MSLKKNILYSGFLATSVYVFQFITFPYIARVLGVTNIGICNYIQSIVSYFSLLSMMGITTLGVREIAKCNGDNEKISRTFSQLFILNASFTIVVLIIYGIMIETLPQFTPYRKLLYIGASQILFNIFTVEWLFRGLEDFKYITIRTMITRTIYVIFIFLFVRNSEDYISYFIIYSGMIVANGIINWNYALRFIKFTSQSIHSIKHHIKPLLFLGAQVILTSLYTTFNIIYLGLTCGDIQVGYYTTATKIENIILALYSSFTVVMMPRISKLMESNSENRVRQMIRQSFNILFAFVFPCIFFAEFYAEELVYLVAGPGYEGAIFPMRILLPIMLIIGLEQILIIQILMPSRADKQIFINSMIGASCSILLNILLVSKLQSIGASIAWCISEIAVMIVATYFVRKRYKDITFFKDALKHLLNFTPLLAILYTLSLTLLPIWLIFSLGILVTLTYSHIVLTYTIKNLAYITLSKSLLVKLCGK